MEHPPRFIGPSSDPLSRARPALSTSLWVVLLAAIPIGANGCLTGPGHHVGGSRSAAKNANSGAEATTSSRGPASAVPAAAPIPRAATEVPKPATPAAPVAPQSKALPWHGMWSTRWRMRDAGQAHDQDVYSVLSLDVGDATRDRVTARLLGRLSADIDGRGDAESQRVFGSLQDTRGRAVYADLYEASIEVDRPFDAPLRARIGRQYETATPEIAHIDGLRVESKELGGSKIVAGAYAGVPVRIYEATSISDQIYGLWGEGRPWKGGRARLDWMHVDEEARPDDFQNDLVGLSLWQRFGERWMLDAGYTRLESENRDVRLRATWNDGRGDWMVQASYYRLLETQRAYAQEFDPFFSILQQFEPYTQYRLLTSKSLGKHLRIDLGGDLRRLEDGDDEGRLNHDYDRGYATVVVSDVFTDGLDLSLTGDAWDGGERDIRTWGADLTWTPNKTWRASIGSAYALYKYDVLQDVERDDVRTWYARLRRALGKAWTLDLEYAYDDDDFDNAQLLTAGATWHF